MAQSPLKDITQPVDSEEEGRSSTTAERKKSPVHGLSVPKVSTCLYYPIAYTLNTYVSQFEIRYTMVEIHDSSLS